MLHSGTVGAALTAAHFGLKGIATSIQAGAVPSSYETYDGAHVHFESAAALAVQFVAHLELAPARTVLNLNVPNLALSDICGIRRASLATSGLILAAAAVDGGPRVRFDLGVSKLGNEDESDETLTQLGWAVVTPLTGVVEDRRHEVGDVVATAMGSPRQFLQKARTA